MPCGPLKISSFPRYVFLFDLAVNDELPQFMKLKQPKCFMESTVDVGDSVCLYLSVQEKVLLHTIVLCENTSIV